MKSHTLQCLGFLVVAAVMLLSCQGKSVTPISSAMPATTELPQATPDSSSNGLFKFSGQVSRGQVFEHEISGNLVFHLEPYQYGWHIWIGDKTEPLYDYVAVVTPPYYGMNARFIEGWHFRNSDNSGPNEPGEKLVNAPQKERRFYFALNETDHQIAYNGLNARLLSSDEEQQQAIAKREQLEPREGMLTITHLELGNLKVGERAWIEYMEFEVGLSLPVDFQYLSCEEEMTSANDDHTPPSKITPTVKFDTPAVNSFDSYSGSIYYLVAEGSASGLWRIDLLDRQKVQLHQDNNITGFDVEISSDGNWIAYSNDTWNDQQERLTSLWVVNTRSQEIRQVSPPLPLVRWRWLPDSNIFYTQYPAYSEGDPILGKLPRPGRNIKSFIYDVAADSRIEAPDLRIPWSYQGDQLCGYQPSPSNPKLLAKVCRNITDETPERPLVVTQIDGSNAVTITTQFTGSSIWSPDGQQLLFSNAPDKNRQLFVWDSRTSETRQITDTSQQFSFFDLTWSPDKQWVAFHENNNEGVCVVNLTTGKITCYSGYRFPVGQKMSWSPDSQAIVIAAVSDINSNPRENDLYLISVPEGHITRLTEDTSQFEYNPIWVE